MPLDTYKLEVEARARVRADVLLVVDEMTKLATCIVSRSASGGIDACICHDFVEHAMKVHRTCRAGMGKIEEVASGCCRGG